MLFTLPLLALAALASPVLAQDEAEWVPSLPGISSVDAQPNTSSLKRQRYICPPGTQYCSARTCAPVGTMCCNAAIYCPAGTYCLVNGRCCPVGKLCYADGSQRPSPPPTKPSAPSQPPTKPSAPSQPPTKPSAPSKPPTPGPSNNPNPNPKPPTKSSGMNGQRRRTVDLEDEIEWEESWETEVSCDPSEKGKKINATGTATWTITNEIMGVAFSTSVDTDEGASADVGFTYKPGGEDSGVELEQTFGFESPGPEAGANATYDGIATGCAITYKYAVKWTQGVVSQETELSYTIPEIMKRAAASGFKINKIEVFASVEEMNAAEEAKPPTLPSAGTTAPPGGSASAVPSDTYTTKPNGKVCKVKPTAGASARRRSHL